MKVKISIVDDNGKTYEGEIELIKAGSIKRTTIRSKSPDSKGYKKGSTTEKIIALIDEKFFDQNRTVGDIIEKLKSKDYHFKSSELTMSLRTIVRKELLKKTKDLPDGTKSKQWTYVKN
ncbi:MAG: hypothetical protein KGI19_08895 [Thaumarchaeota archaeon]|nr:hypothetical protein [Nitrososphaerota archaeon]